MKVKLICSNCNCEFETDFKHRDKKFCNRKCYFEFANKNKLLGKVKDDSVREERTCLECGKIFIERKKHKRKLCSDTCREKWSNKDENKKTRLKKSQDSLLKKYGKKSYFDTNQFKENYTNIFLEKYGVTHPMFKEEFVDKIKISFRDKQIKNILPKLNEYGLTLVDTYTKNKNGNTSKPYNFQCKTCLNIFSSTLLGSGKVPVCRKCHPIIKNSKLEQIIKDFLNENKILHIDNNRKLLEGLEIDILLPEYNMGIEINGNYYHAELSGDKDKNYHLNKMTQAIEKKIKLIQFYEDEILLKKEIVFSRLRNIFNLNEKIFARKCLIKIIDKKTSKNFLNDNHLQGESFDKFRYGLFYNDELVSVMTFGKKRNSLGNKKNNINEYELVRFCNKKNTIIVGGFSKLLNFFIKTHNPSLIETFADVRWSGIDPKDTVYYKNGFEFSHITPPNYWYINKKNYLNRYHRYNFRKDKLVSQGYDKQKTEWEIMSENNYDRIWDCGSLKFFLKM